MEDQIRNLMEMLEHGQGLKRLEKLLTDDGAMGLDRNEWKRAVEAELPSLHWAGEMLVMSARFAESVMDKPDIQKLVDDTKRHIQGE